MLNGRSALSLDAKGRMSVPARLRHRLVDPETGVGVVIITQHPRDFLLIYPQSEWAELAQKLKLLPETDRALKRQVLGSAQEVEIDGSGRVLIPPDLREAARLEKDVTLIGVGNSLELWPTAELKAQEAKDKPVLAASDHAGISL